jgi:PTS system mannose-specific IIA component
MIGLVLVTHGRLAEELRHAMEHVVGPQRAVATVCIGPEDDVEGCRQRIRDGVAEVDQGDGVVLLTDILGGTPSNLAISMMDRGGVEVIAGVNLPLLVKLAKLRGTEPLAEAVDHARAAGRKYMACASEMLNGAGADGVPKPAAAPNGESR